ncbi:MAG: TIGR03118 family protein [Verrucomicrobia bacterium]|nr:TIGR03118 family protein [Verrucomicrobiota bacterium]
MKNVGNLQLRFLKRRTFIVVSACVLIWPAALSAQQYQQHNLVSNIGGLGATTIDPSLVDPWGIARRTTSPWWVADRATGVSTLYTAGSMLYYGTTESKIPLVVTIPHTPQTAKGSPTGIVFNGSNDFALAPGKPAIFLFVSLDGTISGWNPGVSPNLAIEKVPGSTDSVLTGATIAQIGDRRFLYVADIRRGELAVYDTNFNRVKVGEHDFDYDELAFTDEFIPKEFVPFNVQNIGNNLYVAFAQQNQAKNFVMFGAGLGFVDVFSPRGRLLMRLEPGDWFNAPWGLVLASTDFGTFSHKLIVGQFGSGEILAFDAITGRFNGKLRDQNNNVIVIPGLWGISFGAGQPSPQSSGPANALFFNAGIYRGNGGLFGNLTPIPSELTQGGDQ